MSLADPSAVMVPPWNSVFRFRGACVTPTPGVRRHAMREQGCLPCGASREYRYRGAVRRLDIRGIH
jgi:hypothetical protein